MAKAGMIFVSGAYLYYCYADYTSGSLILCDNTVNI